MEVFMKSCVLKKKLIVLLCIPLMFLGYIYTQDASYFSDIIESDAISWEQASFLILSGGEILPEDVAPRDAWDELLSTYWFSNVPERGSHYCSRVLWYGNKTLDYKGGLL